MTKDVVDACKVWMRAKPTVDRVKTYRDVVELWDEIGYIPPVSGSWKRTVRENTGKVTTVIKPATILPDGKLHCVKCGSEVTPGLCYSGKVLEGFINLPIEKVIFNKVTAEFSEEIHKIHLSKYVRGWICDGCASEYRCVVDRNGRQWPIVVTERLHPQASNKPEPEIEGFRSNKGFNTRITR